MINSIKHTFQKIFGLKREKEFSYLNEFSVFVSYNVLLTEADPIKIREFIKKQVEINGEFPGQIENLEIHVRKTQ